MKNSRYRALSSFSRTTSILALSALAFASAGLNAQNVLPGNLRSVVFHNAPYYIQEMERPNDQIWPVDFDGDLIGSNSIGGFMQNGVGYVPYNIVDNTAKIYYSVVETGYGPDDGYYLIGYYVYHARDDGYLLAGIGSDGHWHDMEGVWLALKKSSFAPYGITVAALTEAHSALIPYHPATTPTPWSGYAPQGGWQGTLRSWLDTRYQHYRPVFGVRNGTHGTYAAQDCSGQNFDLFDMSGVGMWLGSVETYGDFRACIHADPGQSIIYYPILEEALVPSFGLPYAEQQDVNKRSGMTLYTLEEVSQSVLWSQRAAGTLFAGPLYPLVGGLSGLGFFDGNNGEQEANPPWAWSGGPGEGHLSHYWYSWGVDRTANGYPRKEWKFAPAGALLGGAAAELAARFPSLPDLAQPVRFNPYVANPPDYNVQALTVGISGPTMVTQGYEDTWSAVVTGGVGPYTYQWSGGLTGNGPSVTGSPSDGDIYLDVWDSAGHHSAIAIYVRIMQECPDFQIIC